MRFIAHQSFDEGYWGEVYFEKNEFEDSDDPYEYVMTPDGGGVRSMWLTPPLLSEFSGGFADIDTPTSDGDDLYGREVFDSTTGDNISHRLLPDIITQFKGYERGEEE